MFAYADIIDSHRPNPIRIPMSIGHRAKQFAPFAALKGYEESVQKKERILHVRADLADEQQEVLDWKLRLLSYGQHISLTYFQRCIEFQNEVGNYYTVDGAVEFISKEEHRMRVGDTVVHFDDIVDIQSDYFEI